MCHNRAVFRLGLLIVLSSWDAIGQCLGHAVLSDYERRAFLTAAYGKRQDVAVQVLAAEGCSRRVVDALRGIGGKARFVDERVGYALVMLDKDRVLDVIDLPGIAYAFATPFDRYRDFFNYYHDPSFVNPPERRAAPLPPVVIPIPRVATTLAPDGPYFAADEAGLTALWREHPEADGRGTRIAVVDRGLDPLHPALMLAKDFAGNPVPKIADFVPFTRSNEDTSWVQFGDPIQTTAGTFSAAGRTWTAPQDGKYSFGIFTKTIYLGNVYYEEQLGRDKTVKKLSLSVGVLWDELNNRVWIDTNGDGSFRDQRALADYAETHDVEYFGSKVGDDDNRIAFGIKIDRERRAVYLSFAEGAHGALIAGPLAANRLTGGLFDGAAPSAQVVDLRTFPEIAVLPSFLTAFARPDVDVIHRSGGVGYRSEDGRWDFERHVLERAITVYDKPIACLSGAVNSLSIFDYQSASMLRRNRQLPPPYLEAMHSQASFTSDGMVNTVLAPSTSLVTQSRYKPFAFLREDGKLYTSDIVLNPPAPAGYLIGANPSPTIPVVSGILADLIGEAKREHVRYNAARLTQAVFSGAHLVAGFSPAEQGFGLVNAADSWKQLTAMANADDPSNPVLTSFTASRLTEGKRIAVNGFQADLPKAGGTLRGDLWITRHGGYRGERPYKFAVHGDDGTFTLLDKSATLAAEHPAHVRFTAKIRPGHQVAFLQVIDANAGVVMHQIPLSLRSPNLPKIVAPGVEEYEATIPPLRSDRRIVRLETETQAALFRMRIPHTGPPLTSARSIPGFRYGVVGMELKDPGLQAGEPVNKEHHVGPIEEFRSFVPVETSKTCDIEWSNRGWPEYATPYDGPAPDVPITGILTVTKYAVAFAKADSQGLRVTNKGADIRGEVLFFDAKLGSIEVKGQGGHSAVALQRTLPPKLAQWRVAVSGESASVKADAFLLDCTDEKNGCSVAAAKIIESRGATLVVDDPQPGNWRIIIRTRKIVGNPLSFHIREASLTPATSSGEIIQANGTTWSLSLPPATSNSQYVAFRIAGIDTQEKTAGSGNGLRIAMTSLTPGAP